MILRPSEFLADLKLVVSDMDGTLLGPGSLLSEITSDAIEQFDKVTGIPFILATGRCRASAMSRLTSCKMNLLEQPGIFLNGAVVYGPEGILIHETCFEATVLEQIVSMFKDESDRVVVMPCSGDLIFAPQRSEISMHLYSKYADPLPTVIEGYSAMLAEIQNMSIHMISLLTAVGEEKRVTAQLRDLFKTMDATNSFTIVNSIPRQVSVLKTTKGAGLAALANFLKIQKHQIVAIGDADNDIEMLDWAGVGVAMGNAKEAVKSHAKFCVNSNSDPLPGVAQFLLTCVAAAADMAGC